MNLSPEVCLEWKNLTYKVKTKNKSWWKSNKSQNDLIILNKGIYKKKNLINSVMQIKLYK